MTLRAASAAFLHGYEMGVRREASSDPEVLLGELQRLDLGERPFAVEGAAMACELADARDEGGRVSELVGRVDLQWRLFLMLGIGCARARLEAGLPVEPLVRDGYGFQLGLQSGVSGVEDATGDDDAELGRGRALWFVTGGDADACAAAIHRSPPHAAALWRGVGTACAFAGDPQHQAERLPTVSGAHAAAVRRGVTRGLELWRTLGDVPDRTRAVWAAVATTSP